MVKIVKNPGNGRLNNLNYLVLNVLINNCHRRKNLSKRAQLCPTTWPATAVAFRVQFSPHAPTNLRTRTAIASYSANLLQSWHLSIADMGLRKILNLKNITVHLWHVAVAGICLPVILGSIARMGKRSFWLHSFQTVCCSHTANYPRVPEDLSAGCGDRGGKPTDRPVVCLSRWGW